MYEIRMHDHGERIHGSVNRIHFAFASFTIGDSFEEFVEPLKELDLLVSTKREEGQVLDGFRINKPAEIKMVTETRKEGLVLVNTGGYNGAENLLEKTIDKLGLITHIVGYSTSRRVMREVLDLVPMIHKLSEYISDIGSIDFTRAWGALTYSAFLCHSEGIECRRANNLAGREYGAPLNKLVNKFKKANGIRS